MAEIMNNENNDTFFLFKIVIIGCSNVGKTEILNSYVNKNYVFENDTKTTIGISYVKIKKKYDNFVNFQIWDTAGEERYRSIIKNYFKKSKGALIVYDITNEQSFNQLDYWFDELKSQTDAEIILVGNKLDLSGERKIAYNAGKDKAKLYNASFFEVSAKKRENINEVFDTLFEKVYQNYKNEFIDDKNSDELSLDETSLDNQSFNNPSFRLDTNTTNTSYEICC